MSKSSRKSLVSDAMPLFSAMVFLNVLLTTHLVGQVPGTRDNNHPPSRLTHWPEYRFIYFPEHAMSDIPMPGFHFSVPAETFRRLVDTAQESGPYGGGSDRQCVLVSLELSARLEKQQLVSGKGVMRINSDFASETNGDANSPAKSRQPDMFVTLSPFGLAVSSPVWSNGEPAQLGLDGNGETVLVISPGASELAFDWTLRRDADSRNDLVFSLNLPRFLKTELVLDLPANTKPIVPFGLVQQVEASDRRNMSTESDIPPGYRRWHVAVNGGQTLRLTVAPDETSEQYLRSIGVSELHSYDLSLFGMQLTSMFFFEKSEFVMDTLTLELSQPLSVLSIKTGDRVLPWTEMPSDDAGVTRLLVSMAHMETGPGEIQMETFCPVQMGRPWDLPRVHLRSPLLFWTETQNLVHVNRPLLTRRIIAPHQKQVTPSGGMDETESDLFVFQSFTEESPLGIELEQKQPMLNLESGTWFQWGEREITARAILYFSVEEGQVQQLELDVDSNWTVDLIEAADSTRVANSFVEDTETDDGIEPLPHTRWIVPLRQAVVPSQPVRLIVQLRRPLDANEQSASSDSARKHRYPLSDFMPIRVPGSHLGQQLIAFDSGRHYRLVADDRQEIIASSPTQEQILERFTQLPSGTVFSINEPFQDHFLEEESLHPACEVAAVTNLVVQQGTLWETCRFSCIPTDNSQVGRLTVRFSAHQQGNDGTDWTWALEEQESGSSLPIQTTRNVSKDSSSIESDETWELELTPPRSMPFQVTATRMTPFDSRQAIPLPFFPDIPEVDALVRIETHDSALYHVAQNLLQAVSLPNEATANISAWHVVRGVYQYPAGGVAFSPENTLLVLEPVSTSVRFQDGSANIWSLALHTHYHPGEKVVSFAVITLENRLLDRLRIGLPPGVTADAIRHLWIDGEKTLWSFAPGTGEGGDLFVPLPSQRRYLTLTLEYVEQGDALPDFRAVLQPAMPTFDVPIFTQKWYAWHPPQYRGF
ncbi:MAG: hypothetical protein FWH27_08150, partial [Planctomycetaceae bacterium]|nr:hypothetical protein [Planctomycetaceae bacterium]